jgi:hypothetical protein
MRMEQKQWHASGEAGQGEVRRWCRAGIFRMRIVNNHAIRQALLLVSYAFVSVIMASKKRESQVRKSYEATTTSSRYSCAGSKIVFSFPY